MTTTWNKITHTTTTPVNTIPGYGIYVDNEDFYCDSEAYYVDGAVVMPKEKAGYGIRCDDLVILCNNRNIDCEGAVIYRKATYGS